MNIATAYTRSSPGLDGARLHLQSLPRTPWGRLHIFLDAHDPDFAEAVIDLACALRPDWEPVACEQQQVRGDEPPDLRRYVEDSIGFKVMLPVRVPAPFVWMDGDVLVTRDPARAFAVPYPWASRMRSFSKAHRPAQFPLWAVDDDIVTADSAVFTCLREPPRYRDDLYRYFSHTAVTSLPEEGRKRFELDRKWLGPWLYREGARFVNVASAAVTGKMAKDDPLYGAYMQAFGKAEAEDIERFGNGTLFHYCHSGKDRGRRLVEKYLTWLDPSGEGFRSDRGSP